MNEKEKCLIELVHYLASGNKGELGLTLKETTEFLLKPIASRDNKTAIDCINQSGSIFLNELKTYMNERWGG